ncbi:MAG: peptide chain release factor N(5)-glutamine methyltransferase [Deltaproteobacteria bacterium]
MRSQSRTSRQWTTGAVLEWTAAYFREKGIPSARLDAEVLLADALEVDRVQLYLDLERPLLSSERDRYRELVKRRALREPTALITGIKEFWSIPFRIVPGVLIPRPETETLVEAVVNEVGTVSSPDILEIGTGSGAVAVAVATELRLASIIATDIDFRALQTAAFNAQETGVSASVRFLASDLFGAVKPGTRFDVICSNPPYIASDVIPTLEPEIVNFEPMSALDGGPEGLDIIRRLASEARDYLKERGALILEIGDRQESSVREIFAAIGIFRDITVARDLAGKVRVVKGKR